MSLCLGGKTQAMVYVLLAAILIIGVFGISLPPALDLTGSSVTLPLNNGAHDFELLRPFIIGRAVFLMLGTATMMFSLGLSNRRQE
jgi:hypothetical protein